MSFVMDGNEILNPLKEGYVDFTAEETDNREKALTLIDHSQRLRTTQMDIVEYGETADHHVIPGRLLAAANRGIDTIFIVVSFRRYGPAFRECRHVLETHLKVKLIIGDTNDENHQQTTGREVSRKIHQEIEDHLEDPEKTYETQVINETVSRRLDTDISQQSAERNLYRALNNWVHAGHLDNRPFDVERVLQLEDYTLDLGLELLYLLTKDMRQLYGDAHVDSEMGAHFSEIFNTITGDIVDVCDQHAGVIDGN